MNEDEAIAARIEEIFRCRPWHGVLPVEVAIANAVEYRNRLTGTRRQLFDDAMREGLLPERAIEMIEYATAQGLIPTEDVTPVLASTK